jgi:DNA polymerase III subunit epsilon
MSMQKTKFKQAPDLEGMKMILKQHNIDCVEDIILKRIQYSWHDNHPKGNIIFLDFEPTSDGRVRESCIKGFEYSLNDGGVYGKCFVYDNSTNDSDVIEKMRLADCIICHCAKHDRKIAEKRYPRIKSMKLAWCCSIEDIPWKKYGYKSNSLELLCLQFGGKYQPHIAENDVDALIFLMTRKFKVNNKYVLQELLDNAFEDSIRIYASYSRYDQKDLLDDNGYKWNKHFRLTNKKGVWWKDVKPEEADREINWLKESFNITADTLPVNAFNKYTEQVEKNIHLSINILDEFKLNNLTEESMIDEWWREWDSNP